MTPYQSEYKRYQRLLSSAVEQLNDEEFFKQLSPSSNSVAIIIKHLSGNWTSRFTDFLTTDGEKPWRNRETEFDVTGLSRADLMEKWDAAWEILSENVFSLTPDDLQRTVTIRGVSLTVDEALMRSITHFSHHVGEIVFLAKYLKGDDWTYLSIAPGGTDAYNKNPTREKG